MTLVGSQQRMLNCLQGPKALLPQKWEGREVLTALLQASKGAVERSMQPRVLWPSVLGPFPFLEGALWSSCVERRLREREIQQNTAPLTSSESTGICSFWGPNISLETSLEKSLQRWIPGSFTRPWENYARPNTEQKYLPYTVLDQANLLLPPVWAAEYSEPSHGRLLMEMLKNRLKDLTLSSLISKK